jgi:hypothetical protein
VSDGKPVKVEVPVELPEGVSELGVPGGSDKFEAGNWSRNGAVASGASGGFGAGTYRIVQPAASPVQSASGYAVNETVEVTANAPLVETSMASIEKAKKPRRDATVKRTETKMSPEVLAIYRCSVRRGVSAAASTCNGTSSPLKVTVDVTELKPGLEQRLTSAGLKIVSGSGSQKLTGTIEPAKLRQLAQIAEVKSISLSQ